MTAFIVWSNLDSTAVKFPAARSATTWSAWEANGPGRVGELLLQADMKATMASDPSTAAQRIMAHAVAHLGSFFNPARISPDAGCDSITKLAELAHADANNRPGRLWTQLDWLAVCVYREQGRRTIVNDGGRPQSCYGSDCKRLVGRTL